MVSWQPRLTANALACTAPNTTNLDRGEMGRSKNKRAENSQMPFRRRERAMLRFRQMKSLQKFASVHAGLHNHFNSERHLVDRKTYNSAAQPHWPSGSHSPPEVGFLSKLRQSETGCGPPNSVRPARVEVLDEQWHRLFDRHHATDGNVDAGEAMFSELCKSKTRSARGLQL